MLEHMDQGVMLIPPNKVVEVCNRRACDLLQIPVNMMMGRPNLNDVSAS